MVNAIRTLLVCFLSGAVTTSAFQVPRPDFPSITKDLVLKASINDQDDTPGLTSRRRSLQHVGMSLLSLGISLTFSVQTAGAEDFAARDAERKYVQESYEDFTKTSDGWLYREVKKGSGDAAKEGDRVVFDWSGYTIGYFGRPFQAKGLVICCRATCLFGSLLSYLFLILSF